MVELIIFAVLLISGFTTGRIAEKRHYRAIRERESAHRGLLVVPMRVPSPTYRAHQSSLVRGSVVTNR